MANRDIRKDVKKKKKASEKAGVSVVSIPTVVQPELARKPKKETDKP